MNLSWREWNFLGDMMTDANDYVQENELEEAAEGRVWATLSEKLGALKPEGEEPPWRPLRDQDGPEYD